ncbi:NUDIX domain-containing protein [Albimonas sp. CAU 1670]|uniref:NUDIX hydrolase n=1 Tax=Albimonas sp. CAU 1670 TaxID=3032599 RepID=UPI0023DAD230|nr:NUDIX domain-containing protein [Albimonas sp. CAU 1670]MDF2233461.1 NUDIX domain-containing protein [Albimonas sp. CAU 1670]
MSEQVPVRAAATIMLLRETPALEVLMVRRNYQIDFFSGAMVFPGGKQTEDDAAPEWAEIAAGWDAVPEVERGPRIAAIRETFEETGMLLAQDAVAGSTEERLAVEHGEIRFLDYVRERGVTPDLRQLTRFARWVTPAHVPKRFDTWFFIARAPLDQDAIHDGRETVETEWIAPAEALRLYEARKRAIVFPTRMNLRLLGEAPDFEAAATAAAARAARTVHPIVDMSTTPRMIRLDPEDGYGIVEERLEIG